MQHIMKILFQVFILMACTYISIAQQVISSAGTNVTGASVQASWTIGEAVIETFTGSSSILSQGFHQGKLTVTLVGKIDNSSIHVYVYPNPVNDKLKVEFNDFSTEKYNFNIADVNSRILLEGLISENPKIIEMNRFKPGIYFMMVGRSSKEQFQIFKIIKQ